jgi:uncharacterized protein (DUF1501 family)
MYLIQPNLHTRRAFLRRSAQLAATGVALPTALNLAALGEAAAFDATDYKALVCVFLYGGNDYANTVVSYDDASYNKYSAIRGGGANQAAGGIALEKAALTPTLLVPTSPRADSLQYALHPSMAGLAGLFNAGKAAVQLNVGPLAVPTDKQQYLNGSVALPPKLFSHNDQQSLWQSSSPEGSTVGWGGNIGDLALASNAGSSQFTCISVTGNAVFLAGDQALSYQVGSSGAVRINSVGDTASPYGFKEVGSAMNRMTRDVTRSHLLEREYNRVTNRAVESEGLITNAISNSSIATNNAYPAPFDAFGAGNPLADQMRMVARLIKERVALGVARQVFMVSLGGFDLHDNLISKQPALLQRVSDAMTAFYNTTVSLGVADKVTAFTASDFGRTLSSNGDGSDHGWGSHHMVVGGAVRGGAFYGYAPPVSVGERRSLAAADLWQVGQGRLLPTTSVDQYAATLASWFGVEPGELDGILPNLRNFGGSQDGISYPKTLGFLP